MYDEVIPYNRTMGALPLILYSFFVHTYFISYLLTCEVDLFEVLEIMTQMWRYIIF